MKKHALVLFIFLSSGLLFAQDYLNFKGNIGPTSVLLNLKKMEENQDGQLISTWQGSYYEVNEEIPKLLIQTSSDKDSLILVKYDDEENKETFSGKLHKGVYSGIWTKNGENLNFNLKPNKKFTEMVHFNKEKIVPLDFIKGAGDTKATFIIDFYLPKNTELHQQIIEYLFENYTNFDSYAHASLAADEAEYKADIQDFIQVFPMDESEMPMSSWNHEKYQYFSPYMETEKYLTFTYAGYQYTGGAHGISYELFVIYDKKQKKFIELSDVLNLNQSTEIENTINAAIREKHQIPSDQDLNASEDSIFLVEKAEISDNFTLSKHGITFHYGLYELTPYVYGYYEIFVPYEALKNNLKAGFKY